MKARSESATVADSPAAINRNIEYSNAAEPVVSIDKKIAVANNNAYQKPPKKLNRKLHADEDRDEKEWMKQKVVYDENNEETNNEGDENGDDDEEKSIIEEKLSELELQKREEIAQIRRKFKEKHKTLLMKLKQKNDAEAEKVCGRLFIVNNSCNCIYYQVTKLWIMLLLHCLIAKKCYL